MFANGSYGDVFQDAPSADKYNVLSLGCFRWLINIRPGYLVCRFGPMCLIEPYLPSRFARQFGYDQLYVGNPNRWLAYEGSLIDRARAWLWSSAGCTCATFALPPRDPNLRTTLAYCQWHRGVIVPPEKYDLGTSGLKSIIARLPERLLPAKRRPKSGAQQRKNAKSLKREFPPL